MLYGFLIFIHLLVSVALILAVLLQASKGGGLAGTFGGSGVSGGVFGGRGAAPLLVKATTTFAIMFMLTSIALNFVSPKGSSQSVLDRVNLEAGAPGSTPAVLDQMPITTGETEAVTLPEDAENTTETPDEN